MTSPCLSARRLQPSETLTAPAGRNTTLRHPSAKVGPDACIGEDDVTIHRAIKRYRFHHIHTPGNVIPEHAVSPTGNSHPTYPSGRMMGFATPTTPAAHSAEFARSRSMSYGNHGMLSPSSSSPPSSSSGFSSAARGLESPTPSRPGAVGRSAASTPERKMSRRRSFLRKLLGKKDY